MKPFVFAVFYSSVAFLLSFPSGSYAQLAPSESSRMKLYVGEFKGDEDLVKSIREHLVDELAKRGVALSPSDEEADAVLVGASIHRVGKRLMFRSKATMSIVIRGDIQLNARNGRKLWSSDVSSTRWAVSETQSFADIAASRTAQVLRQMTPRRSPNPK